MLWEDRQSKHYFGRHFNHEMNEPLWTEKWAEWMGSTKAGWKASNNSSGWIGGGVIDQAGNYIHKSLI